MTLQSTTSVKSAIRVLELLEFFAEWRRPASVKEISQTLGYPQSSTSILLKCLKESGYFDYDMRTGMYVPNIRLTLATAWVEEHMYSEQSLLRLMEGVLAATGHTVMIGARHGTHVRYLHVLQATRLGSFKSKSGLLRPLFRSATGKMLLTTLPERDVAKLLRHANAEEADALLQVGLDQALAERRAAIIDGYAVSLGTSVPGAAALAVLIPGTQNMTLSVGGPVDEIQKELPALLQVLNNAVQPFMYAKGNAKLKNRL